MGQLTTNTRGSQYSDEDRRQAVIEFYVHGNLTRVSKRLSIPVTTLSDWTRQEWWEALAAEIRTQVDQRILASNLAIAQRAQDAILERLENGDTRVLANGERVSQPVSARDLSVIGGIAQDKARVQQNMPTSISGKSATEAALAGLADFLKQIAREEKVVSDQ